jgi:hypothetical protein
LTFLILEKLVKADILLSEFCFEGGTNPPSCYV